MPVSSFAGKPAWPKLPSDHRRVMAAACAIAWSFSLVQAQTLPPSGDSIGWIQQSRGVVSLSRPGEPVRLVSDGTALRAGDLVETQAAGALALRFADGTQVQLGASSRFNVSQYVLDAARPQNEQFASRLIKGVMRMVTGAMARRRPESFSLSSPTSTVGIRGTDFTMRVCEDDCRPGPTAQVAGWLPEIAGRVGGAAAGLSAIDRRGHWRVLTAGAPLRPGDTVVTGRNGMGILVLTDGTRISLDPKSRLWLAEYEFNEQRPTEGRIAMELLRGAAQVTTGRLSKLRSERFAFAAGDQLVRVHGTSFGAVVNAVSNVVNDGADRARDAAQDAPNPSAAVITAMQAAAAPVLNAMAAQMDALRNNPPQSEAAAQAASAAAQNLARQLQQVVAAVMPSAGQTDEMKEAFAALTVLRWRFSLAVASSLEDAATAGAQSGLTMATLSSLNAELRVMQTNPDSARFMDRVGLGPQDMQRLLELTSLADAAQSLTVQEFLADQTNGYFQAQSNAAANRLNTAAAALADAARTRAAQAEAAARQFVNQSGPGGSLGMPPSQQGQRQEVPCVPAPPAPCVPVPIPNVTGVPGGPNLGSNNYDITGGLVTAGGQPVAVTNGQFSTRITARVERQEDTQRTVIETTEVIDPPTLVRTADGRWLTGGTILRRIDRMPHGDSITTTYVGLTFTAPGQAPGTLLTACSSCSALVMTQFEPSAAAIAAGQNGGDQSSGTQAGGSWRPVQTGDDPGAGYPPGSAAVVVSQGLVSTQSRDNAGTPPTFVAAGETAQAQPGSTGIALIKGRKLDFAAPPVGETALAVDMRRFFGPNLTTQTQASGTAPAGTYVHVREGAVSVTQGGQEVVVEQGETAVGPANGSPPSKVRSGVTVAGAGLLEALRLAAANSCRADDVSGTAGGSSAGGTPGGKRLTASSDDLSRLRWRGQVNSRFRDTPTGGTTTSNWSEKGWGPGFGSNYQTITDAAKGKDIKGAGRLQGGELIVGGRYADTFQGGLINSQVADVTLGGQPGRIGNLPGGGKVSSGGDDLAGLIAEMLTLEGGKPTGDAGKDAAELAYAQSVGTDGYAATKDMSAEDRAAYWLDAQDEQMSGGLIVSKDQADYQVERQSRGWRPRGDDNPSGGGSGIPVFLREGQFGNEVRGVERAVKARTNAAGGANDGRTDLQGAGGGTGGVMLQDNQRAGAATRQAQTGTLNLDAALHLNPLVNPGAR